MSPRIVDAVKQRRKDEKFNDVFHAIAKSDTPPTKGEIALETHRSERQVQRILSELREAGRVRRVRDETDGRIVRYDISTTSTTEEIKEVKYDR